MHGQWNEFAKDISAMANTRGGLLIYGVANDHSVVGIDWEKADLRQYSAPTGENECDEPLQDVEVTVRTWPLGLLGYLVTWCNDDDKVLMYSLTTRSRLFRPRVSIGPHRITLGKTPLAALPSPNVENSRP
ncbi:hypothetical protein ADK56_03320 [Streptomyces sp. MMG1522]|nr:hypothetical protein ADK56_03320 [Streptomyces sp. MMG1522]